MRKGGEAACGMTWKWYVQEFSCANSDPYAGDDKIEEILACPDTYNTVLAAFSQEAIFNPYSLHTRST